MDSIPSSIEQLNCELAAEAKTAESGFVQQISIRNRSTLPWVLAAVCLAVVFLVDNHRIVTGTDAPTWDAYAFYAAEYTLVADHARSGRLLLWNPWASGGEPDFAEPQIGAASPIVVLLGAITGGTEAGFRVYWILIWFVGPLGMLLLGRHLNVAPWAAFIMALGFAFCGFYIGHAEHTTFIYSLSWLPLIVWRLDAALKTHRLMAAAEAGVLWGLSALGGYPALTVLTAGFLGVWVLGRSITSDDSLLIPASIGDRLRIAGLCLVVVAFVGSVVFAPTYVAFFREGVGYSERTGAISRQLAIASNASDPGTFLGFASPYLGILKYPWWNPHLWQITDGSGAHNYIGVLPFIFGLLALVLRPRSLWRWWLLGIIVFACACAVGPHLPIRGWLYDYCPPTRFFRHSEIFRVYAIFSANVLALLATKEFVPGDEKRFETLGKRFSLVAVVAATCALWAYLYVIFHVWNLGDQIRRSNWHVVGAWCGAMAISTLAVSVPRAKTWLPGLLVILALADASLTIRLSQRFVSDHDFARRTWNRINAEHKSTLDLTLEGLQRQARPPAWVAPTNQNNNVPLRVATLFNDFAAKNRFHLDYEHHPVLVDMSTGDDRIWFSKIVTIATPTDEAYDAFVKRATALGQPVLVVHPPQEMWKISESKLSKPANSADISAISTLPAAEKVSAQVLRYEPNYLEMKVISPDQGWLLVTDRWASGWRVTVNGVAAQVFGGDFIFRAIRVQVGENIIKFYYPQRLYFTLVCFSWGMLTIVLILVPAARKLNLVRLVPKRATDQ